MKAILKYPLQNTPGTDQDVVIQGSLEKILSVQLQRGIPSLWAVVDTDSTESQTLTIRELGTGWKFDNLDGFEYISTAQDNVGFVWHYFVGKSEAK